MPVLLVSHQLHTERGTALAADARAAGVALELVVLPADPGARLADADCVRLDCAFFSHDVFPDHARQFFSAVRKSPALQWLHVFNAGVDHPIYSEMLARGVYLAPSAYEAGFVSAAHGAREVEETLAAAREAFRQG